MVRTHQPGEAAFRSILPEDVDWKPFAAFPRINPAGRRQLEAVRGFPPDSSASSTCWRAESARTLCHQGQGTVWCDTDAAQTSGGSNLHGDVGRFLYRAWRSIRRRQGESLSARLRGCTARRYPSFPLGQIRRVRHAGHGDRAAWPRICGCARRSAEQEVVTGLLTAATLRWRDCPKGRISVPEDLMDRLVFTYLSAPIRGEVVVQ